MKKKKLRLEYIIAPVLALILGRATANSESNSQDNKENTRCPLKYQLVVDIGGRKVSEEMGDVQDDKIILSAGSPRSSEIYVDNLKDEKGPKKLTEHTELEGIADSGAFLYKDKKGREFAGFIRRTIQDDGRVTGRVYGMSIEGGKAKPITPKKEDWWQYFITPKNTGVGIKSGKVNVDGEETGAIGTHVSISLDETKIITHYRKRNQSYKLYTQQKQEDGKWTAPVEIQIPEEYAECHSPQYVDNDHFLTAKDNLFYLMKIKDGKARVVKSYDIGNSIFSPYVEDGKVYFSLNRSGIYSGNLTDKLNENTKEDEREKRER